MLSNRLEIRRILRLHATAGGCAHHALAFSNLPKMLMSSSKGAAGPQVVTCLDAGSFSLYIFI